MIKVLKKLNFSYLSLLTTIVAYLLVSPILSGVFSTLFLDLLFSLILLGSLNILGRGKQSFYISLAVATPIILLVWLAHFDDSAWIRIAGNLLFMCYIGTTIAVLLYHIFLRDEVQIDLIFGVFSVFLLTGFFWALVYSTLEIFFPGSFAGIDEFFIKETREPYTSNFEVLLYFSFVTLTTLGYGDVTPLTHFTRNLSMMEAVMGQFYIATFVASLMGRLSRHR